MTERQHTASSGRWSAIFDLRNDVPTDADVVREVWTSNDYRVDTVRGLSGTVIDVGANIGAFTVLAAKAGAELVVAVEPEPANRDRLRHHIALNGVAHQVALLPLAVTDGSSATVTMHGTGGGARSENGGGEGEVETITLATLIDAFAPVALLKMDIEGGEFAAFEVLPVERLRKVERIVMEWHGPAMPHLTHLQGDEFGPLVTKLADAGRVETFGHPARGGLIHWTRY